MPDRAPQDRRTVIRVYRSPVNARQWFITLECGHEFWVTAARKPTRRTVRCPTCAKLGAS